MKFHFANGEKLTRINIPVIIIHSKDDGYIPFSQATRLYDAANEPKVLIETRGTHFESFEQNGADLEILKRHLGLVKYSG